MNTSRGPVVDEAGAREGPARGLDRGRRPRRVREGAAARRQPAARRVARPAPAALPARRLGGPRDPPVRRTPTWAWPAAASRARSTCSRAATAATRRGCRSWSTRRPSRAARQARLAKRLDRRDQAGGRRTARAARRRSTNILDVCVQRPFSGRSGILLYRRALVLHPDTAPDRPTHPDILVTTKSLRHAGPCACARVPLPTGTTVASCVDCIGRQRNVVCPMKGRVSR